MSGAVAAHAAYNGSGTQGLAVTNKVGDDVMSVFWNKNDTTRQLLFGNSIIEIPSSGASVVTFGSTRIFTINNDIDAVGDMYLEIEGSIPNYSVADTNDTVAVSPKPFALQTLVSRIEIQVGTQIWQTIENSDLRAVNSTEIPAGSFTETSKLSTPSSLIAGAESAWLVIPSLTKTLGPQFTKFANHSEDGYPMAAAPHQSVTVKVYFREAFASSLHLASPLAGLQPAQTLHIEEDVPINASGSVAATKNAQEEILTKDVNNPGEIKSCKLYAKQQIMCNDEREQMKTLPSGLPKRLSMTQSSYTTDLGSSRIKTIELDQFSLFASHLIICGNVGTQSDGTVIRLQTAELKLNSSSFSGQLPGVLLDSCTSDSLGLYSNKYIYGETVTDGPAGDPPKADLHIEEFGMGTYVFPIATTAFSGSSVPLNRFDSIRLTLTFTSAPQSGTGTFINVTCVGETTALFKGGAASLAMY